VTCEKEKTSEHVNIAPIITSSDSVSALEDNPFIYVVTYEEPDGPDTVITFHNYASWLSHDADSLFGTPLEGDGDTAFSVIVSDGTVADSLEVTVTVEAINDAPEIVSADTAEASGGIPFFYQVEYADPDDGMAIIEYVGYPSWLTSQADSIFGTPPDGLDDTTFSVIVSDGVLADTLDVTIKMMPCIAVYGDTRTGHDIHQQIVNLIVAHKPVAAFHTGDLVANGLDSSQWTIFNSISSEMLSTAEFYPALGNHEYQSPFFFDNFELPNNEQWFSVEFNQTHFIILNSCVATDVGSEQYQWLESDLASIGDSIEFIAAVFHHPPYSTGPHTEDEMGLRETFVPLFEQHGVDIVFNGHDHDYERSYCGGIYYIVTGGGGAPLRDQARSHPCSQLFLKTYHYCKLSILEKRFIVKVYDNTSQLIDEFEISH
jgi:hypothetical protein